MTVFIPSSLQPASRAMACPFSIDDDTPLDAEATRILDAVIAAERRRLALALGIAGGATRYAFPRNDADAEITVAIGGVTGARYAMDRLIASRARGEAYRLRPSPEAQMVELQARVSRNEAAAKVADLGPVIAVTRRINPHTYPYPSVADAYQSGFHPSCGV